MLCLNLSWAPRFVYITISEHVLMYALEQCVRASIFQLFSKNTRYAKASGKTPIPPYP